MKEAQFDLSALGLSSFEEQVYLALIHHGRLTVAQLVKRTQIKRSTVYLALGALGAQNFIRQTIIGKRIHYLPEAPATLLRSFDQKRKRIEMQLPDLEAIFKAASTEPVVVTHIGRPAIRSLVERIQSDALWAKSVFSPDSYYRVFTEKDSLAFASDFKKRDAKIMSLVPDTSLGRKIIARNVKAGLSRKNRLLPKDVPVSVNSIVSGDTVILISYENVFAVEITNQEIARYFEQQFDTWWEKLSVIA